MLFSLEATSGIHLSELLIMDVSRNKPLALSVLSVVVLTDVRASGRVLSTGDAWTDCRRDVC